MIRREPCVVAQMRGCNEGVLAYFVSVFALFDLDTSFALHYHIVLQACVSLGSLMESTIRSFHHSASYIISLGFCTAASLM